MNAAIKRLIVSRRNRVDPWGDLHAVASRGLFTGNRGCVVNEREDVVRHHGSSLWITCLTEFRGWRWSLARPKRWTPLFFLDDAVALAAGHRPCATCRQTDYIAYRDAVSRAEHSPRPLLARELNERLQAQRLHQGRGLVRAADRMLWRSMLADLPDGTVVVDTNRTCELVLGEHLLSFSFAGWGNARHRPIDAEVDVLTPPVSVRALKGGYRPVLHPSAQIVGVQGDKN